ncbi:energy transducer TonB [Rhodanobacter sp. Soil772]|nr:energy transducer TonB [Rhodanobacter sp. Soil772]
MFRSLFAASRRHALVLVPLMVLLAFGGGVFWYGRATAEAAMVDLGPLPADTVDTAADDAQSGSGILLGLARDAMHDGRLVAPVGSNAFEFYLSVLQLDPGNKTAGEALRESFPRAADEIEHTINRRELEEARREIDLLREFDRDNFTLALLGGKLSAARNIVMRQHEAEAERIRQANAARGAAM